MVVTVEAIILFYLLIVWVVLKSRKLQGITEAEWIR
jgi:hypothetical protein